MEPVGVEVEERRVLQLNLAVLIQVQDQGIAAGGDSLTIRPRSIFLMI